MRGDTAQVLTIFSPEVLLSLLLCFFVLRRYYLARRSANNCSDHGRRLPPSPPKLPLIGHLHLVGPDPHISLAELSRKHAGRDGLMLLRLGQVPNLVVSSPSAAEAVLRTHDHVFASRPPSIVAGVLLSGPSDVALTPYGEYWRQARKLVTTHLLSARKVRALQGGREEEVRLVVAKLRAAAAARSAVDMTELLGGFTNDVVCRAVSGKFFREEGRNELFRELIAGNVAAIGGFNLEDYFPSLAKVGLLRRVVLGKTRRLKKRWDELLDKIIDDHATKSPWLVGVHQHQPNEQEQNQQDEDRDLVDVLLSLQHEYNLTRGNVKAILLDMFSAGTDTSSIVLEFAMAELMRKPHLMAKLQADVRSKTPKTQQTVKEDDLGNMSYLKAVVKETLRLPPPAPLLLPHLSMAECDDVNGYMVPAGTRVIINAWALCRDTESWGMKAEEFWPERFMDGAKAAADFKGRDFQFLPFGAGRRICPGMGFGLATVEAMLANLVYCFDWELPDGMREEDVDMADVFGVTMRRKEKLVLVPRIPQDANI
ncbi:indole-2-monooxygenase-like isoform X2 [Triticum urartu]|uniref:indole-2-monooxygenase-like isoform X1 n=1 Tax=Triticum urartu TaxID=4572 RepID=UPI00204322BB|nr:indole-2-monooxygenase-like isoform X1 [Triticum urartu]XP_048549612.1 indole-2-monooxygenase-like isoform X2 [Triticum urartu]